MYASPPLFFAVVVTKYKLNLIDFNVFAKGRALIGLIVIVFLFESLLTLDFSKIKFRMLFQVKKLNLSKGEIHIFTFHDKCLKITLEI